MEATDVMDGLRVDALKSIAKQAGLPKTITRKPELIEALNRFLETDPAAYVARLAPTERKFLAEAVHNNNRVSPAVFAAKYNTACPQPHPWDTHASLLNLVIVQERGESEVEVPRTIADMLRPLLQKPAAPQPVTASQIPETLDLSGEGHNDPTAIRPIHIHLGERAAFVELARMLRLVQGGKVRVQPKSGRPTPATEREVAASLAMPDFDLELPETVRDEYSLEGGSVRAHAWPVLVQQCGWCKASGGALKLTREGQRLLLNFSPQAFRDGIGNLEADDKFDELQRINHIRGQSGNARRWMTKPSERRAEIFDGLADFPVNEWLAFDEACRFLDACGHDFSVTSNPMSLYFLEHRYGYITNDGELDRQYLRVLLLESLATLGLVDVAYVYPHLLWPELGGGWGTDDMDFCGRYDGLLYVRLNPLGHYCLSASGEYTPPAAEKPKLFTVLPNRDIAVTRGQELLPGDVSMLELFALKTSDHVWRIDPPLMLDHLESGGVLDDFSRFLTGNAAEEVPDTIRVLFDDLKARAGAVAATQEAYLVEFRDPAVAALVAHDSKAGKLCLLAGERHVAVPKANEKAFRTAVKKLGYVVPR